jgi:hypothetical protein
MSAHGLFGGGRDLVSDAANSAVRKRVQVIFLSTFEHQVARGVGRMVMRVAVVASMVPMIITISLDDTTAVAKSKHPQCHPERREAGLHGERRFAKSRHYDQHRRDRGRRSGDRGTHAGAAHRDIGRWSGHHHQRPCRSF